jgi:regulator of replication initiation timing
VLNHENKEKRRLAASMHRGGGGADENDDNEDEDDFVDARESQAPMSPTFRRLLARARSDKDLRNIVEELYTENSTLKDVLDKVSKRLHNFELNSQSSHLALAQSLRLQRPTSPISSSGLGLAAGVAGAGAGASAGEEALRKRNRELEEQMSEMVQRMNSLEKDHLKLQVTLEKYRDRWEKLKAGAKARRSAQDLVYDGESRR